MEPIRQLFSAFAAACACALRLFSRKSAALKSSTRVSQESLCKYRSAPVFYGLAWRLQMAEFKNAGSNSPGSWVMIQAALLQYPRARWTFQLNPAINGYVRYFVIAHHSISREMNSRIVARRQTATASRNMPALGEWF